MGDDNIETFDLRSFFYRVRSTNTILKQQKQQKKTHIRSDDKIIEENACVTYTMKIFVDDWNTSTRLPTVCAYVSGKGIPSIIYSIGVPIPVGYFSFRHRIGGTEFSLKRKLHAQSHAAFSTANQWVCTAHGVCTNGEKKMQDIAPQANQRNERHEYYVQFV